MRVIDLGLIDYGSALEKQESQVTVTQHDINGESLLVCEHPFVVTVGRAIGAGDDVLDKSVPMFEVARGGRSTLHAPGQLVIYPILNLARRNLDVHKMLRLQEQAIIDTLEEFGISACRIDGKTGVWVSDSKLGGERKIASLGIAVRQGISYHGLALNVVNDLNLFKKINPCGFSSNVMTSVKAELLQEESSSDSQEDVQDDEELKEQIKASLIANLKDLLGE